MTVYTPLSIHDLLDDLVRQSRSKSRSGFCSVADQTGAPIRYNSKIEPDSAVYELALPGYDKSEVEVRLGSSHLEVSSKSTSTRDSSWQVIGAPKTPFTVRFYVGSGATVSSACMVNGLLTISLTRSPSADSVSVPVT